MSNSEIQKTILVIDDDGPIRESLNDLLLEQGYKVLTAKNGEEGLILAQAHKPNLILLDLRMPVMDGWEFKKEIEKDPELNKIPILVFSANQHSEPPNIKVQGYIPKPVDIDDLLGKIDTWLAAS